MSASPSYRSWGVLARAGEACHRPGDDLAFAGIRSRTSGEILFLLWPERKALRGQTRPTDTDKDRQMSVDVGLEPCAFCTPTRTDMSVFVGHVAGQIGLADRQTDSPLIGESVSVGPNTAPTSKSGMRKCRSA